MSTHLTVDQETALETAIAAVCASHGISKVALAEYIADWLVYDADINEILSRHADDIDFHEIKRATKARLAEQPGYGWSKEAKKYWSNLADQLDGAAEAVREAVSEAVSEAVKGRKPPKAAAKPKSTKRRKNAAPRQRPAIVQAGRSA
jgi:hypothetical protein